MDFLTPWKDADPEIPILKQTKADYVKLLRAGFVRLAHSPTSSNTAAWVT